MDNRAGKGIARVDETVNDLFAAAEQIYDLLNQKRFLPNNNKPTSKNRGGQPSSDTKTPSSSASTNLLTQPPPSYRSEPINAPARNSARDRVQKPKPAKEADKRCPSKRAEAKKQKPKKEDGSEADVEPQPSQVVAAPSPATSPNPPTPKGPQVSQILPASSTPSPATATKTPAAAAAAAPSSATTTPTLMPTPLPPLICRSRSTKKSKKDAKRKKSVKPSIAIKYVTSNTGVLDGRSTTIFKQGIRSFDYPKEVEETRMELEYEMGVCGVNKEPTHIPATLVVSQPNEEGWIEVNYSVQGPEGSTLFELTTKLRGDEVDDLTLN